MRCSDLAAQEGDPEGIFRAARMAVFVAPSLPSAYFKVTANGSIFQCSGNAQYLKDAARNRERIAELQRREARRHATS